METSSSVAWAIKKTEVVMRDALLFRTTRRERAAAAVGRPGTPGATGTPVRGAAHIEDQLRQGIYTRSRFDRIVVRRPSRLEPYEKPATTRHAIAEWMPIEVAAKLHTFLGTVKAAALSSSSGGNRREKRAYRDLTLGAVSNINLRRPQLPLRVHRGRKGEQ